MINLSPAARFDGPEKTEFGGGERRDEHLDFYQVISRLLDQALLPTLLPVSSYKTPYREPQL
jgi:hypothetical protein